MSKKLYETLDNFISLENDGLIENAEINFHIDIQPNLISYGGDYLYANGECKPIDLQKIGKHRCHLFSEFIRDFHREHTDCGRNKWNKVAIKKAKDGVYVAQFIWDEEWERSEIDAYTTSEGERGKWYWEENNYAQ